MNLLHMKYAVEIAEAKSINRASETLFVGQLRLGGSDGGKARNGGHVECDKGQQRRHRYACRLHHYLSLIHI